VSEKFKVGQLVFIICFRGSKQEKQGIVTKIGSKYIYVDIWMGGNYNYEVIFNKETRLEKNRYASDYKLYYDEQEHKDATYISTIKKKLRNTFSDYAKPKLSLELAQKFEILLNEMENENERNNKQIRTHN